LWLRPALRDVSLRRNLRLSLPALWLRPALRALTSLRDVSLRRSLRLSQQGQGALRHACYKCRLMA
jgi:hypothetical protein